MRFKQWLQENKMPPIRAGSLSYTVTEEGDKVRKTPNAGFGFYPKMDLQIIKGLGNLCPPTEYDEKTNSLVQQRIEGRFATPEEMQQVMAAIKAKGFTPRGLLAHDVIVDNAGRPWVVDVSHFERDIDGRV